jgi:hypothetical protein
MAFVSTGMRIRKNNMVLARTNAQVLRGLAQIEQSQVLDYGAANNLTASSTVSTLQKLQDQVKAEIQRNRSLQKQATGAAAVPVPL